MANPTKKHVNVEKTIDNFSPRPRIQSIKNDTCSWCGLEAINFSDELSRKEYRISGLCQKCQDETFGEE